MTTDTFAPTALFGAAAADLATRMLPSVVQVRGQGGNSAGSGVVWRDSSTVITNFHVVAGMGDKIYVLTRDERHLPAALIAGNPRLDLALLSVAAGGLSPAQLGDSKKLRVGDLVFAIGNPWGQRGVVTAGIVSGVGEIEASRDEQRAQYIRSDVRLAPGNSGGPLLNARGEVIGINAMIFGGDLSVAIPSHVALEWATRLPEKPVYLGVGVQPVEVQNRLGVTQARGLLVAAITPAGPADKAGLLVGDLLLSLDSATLTHSEALIDALAQHEPGDTIKLEVLRGGRQRSIQATLAAQL